MQGGRQRIRTGEQFRSCIYRQERSRRNLELVKQPAQRQSACKDNTEGDESHRARVGCLKAVPGACQGG